MRKQVFVCVCACLDLLPQLCRAASARGRGGVSMQVWARSCVCASVDACMCTVEVHACVLCTSLCKGRHQRVSMCKLGVAVKKVLSLCGCFVLVRVCAVEGLR